MSEEQIQYPGIEEIVAGLQVRKRFDPDIVAAMSRSLAEIGQLQPIRVRRVDDKFVIVDGELRYRAAKLAGFKTMAVIVEEKELCEGEVVHRQIISNTHRANLNEVEKARAIQHLMEETEWTATRVAEKLGLSDATVTRLLGMLSLSPSILKQVETGALPASTAYEISRIVDPEQQAELASKVVTGQLTRDRLIGMIKAQKRNGNGAQNSRRVPSRITAKLGEGKSVTVCAPELSLDALNEILDRLKGHIRQAIAKGWSLDTLLKMLRDTSGGDGAASQAA